MRYLDPFEALKFPAAHFSLLSVVGRFRLDVASHFHSNALSP
jgi:hypothetical protein